MNFQRSSHRERRPHVFQREESKRGKGERSMDGITRSPSPAFPLLSLPTYFFFIWILKRESSIDGEVVRERVACFVKRRSLSKPRKKPALFVLSLAGWRNIQTSLLEKACKVSQFEYREGGGQSIRSKRKSNFRAGDRSRSAPFPFDRSNYSSPVAF